MPQSLANILIHAIWSVKERRPLIADNLRAGLHGYMAGILKNIDSPALIINSVADHIHVLCQLSKNLATCKLVEEVKKSSSKWMKNQGVLGFAWQNGYGAFSVSQSNVPDVRKYLEGQVEHHKKRDFKTSSGNFASDTMSQLMSVMCGTDFVTPFQGFEMLLGHCSQGVALGCPVLRFQRGDLQPETLGHDSPGQSEASPWVKEPPELRAQKGRNNSPIIVQNSSFIIRRSSFAAC